MGEQPPNVRAAQHIIDMSEKLEAERIKNTRLEWRIRDLEGALRDVTEHLEALTGSIVLEREWPGLGAHVKAARDIARTALAADSTEGGERRD